MPPASSTVFSAEAYHVIGLMDGTLTLDQIWSQACGSLGDDMPTQEEVIQLLFQLHQANVLQTGYAGRMSRTCTAGRCRREEKSCSASCLSPFAIRFPIFDPDRYLSATRFLARLLFSWPGLCAWGVAVVSGLILAGIHWSELTQNAADRILAMENLFFIGLVYPVIKTFHEFGHAYAVKRWGGEVHEMGVMLLVFMPIPYVDATSSSAFREKYKRILVGAAGIMVELFFAALAMWVWAGVAPGALRALAFKRDGHRRGFHPALQRKSAPALRRLLHPVRLSGNSQFRYPRKQLCRVSGQTLYRPA